MIKCNGRIYVVMMFCFKIKEIICFEEKRLMWDVRNISFFYKKILFCRDNILFCLGREIF